MIELELVPNRYRLDEIIGKFYDFDETARISGIISDDKAMFKILPYISLFLLDRNKLLLTYDEDIIVSPRSFDISLSHNSRIGESEVLLQVYSSAHSVGSKFSYYINGLDISNISCIYRDITQSKDGQEVFIIHYYSESKL